MGSIPGLGRSLGEGNGNPLWYSCLGNPMGRGAWGHKESDKTKQKMPLIVSRTAVLKCQRKNAASCNQGILWIIKCIC